MDVNVVPCVQIAAAEWYDRDDWRRYIDAKDTATWHEKGEVPTECSDVFTIYDNGEGPDSEVIPSDIWEAIGAAVRSQGFEYAVVRIIPI
jgi:hypothetical protein